MILSDQQREENFMEFLRFTNEPDYYDVTFDEKSGGVSAIHVSHRFDKTQGPWGQRRGDYELMATNILRQNGHLIILGPETNELCKKCFDGMLDGMPCEIKTIEGNGRWAVRTKIVDAVKQGAECVVLFFPDSSLLSIPKIVEGWKMYEEARPWNPTWCYLSRILVAWDSGLIEIEKPPR